MELHIQWVSWVRNYPEEEEATDRNITKTRSTEVF
jgi:hypothetical protein